MYFTRRVIGPETYLYYPYETEDLMDYHLKMINCSNQGVLSKISLKAGNFEHCITSYLPIDLYFKSLNNDISAIKKLFLKIIASIESLEEYLLDMNQIILEKEYIYYDVNTDDIRFIYLPIHSIKNKNQQFKIKKLCLSLMYEFMSFESLGHHQTLLEMLQSEAVDIFALKLCLSDTTVKKIEKKTSWLSQIFIKKEPIKRKESLVKSSVVKEDHEKELMLESPDTIVEEETVILSSIVERVMCFANRRIEINKPSFLIGRSSTLCDFSVPEALTMGRVHVEIKSENQDYFIMDLNTKNGTYINGKRIESQKLYKLHVNDCIEMGQEKAVFE